MNKFGGFTFFGWTGIHFYLNPIWNKALEFQYDFGNLSDNTYLDFTFRWNKNQDHAGINIELTIMDVFLNLTIYDVRHWNKGKNQWNEPGDNWSCSEEV